MNVFDTFSEGCSSSSSNNHKHDVFLSFRGVDTRNSFTDHLHRALQDANISTFLDEEGLETGGDLKPELQSAIKASRAAVIVLSQNYANSSWCLDELVLILEQRTRSNQIVIPIFYHVEPTHLRKQESTFGEAMDEHRRKLEKEENADKRTHMAKRINGWINALTQVADLKGESASGRLETKLIEEIVEEVNRRLHVPLRSALSEPIGMKDSIDFVTLWLKDASSKTGDILTILGMGGIGKTSLTKYVYGIHCREFATSSYINDISRRCGGENNYGLLDLTKQLYGDISKRSSIQNYDFSMYTTKIENVVAHKKVFLVLDGIDSLDQLDTLLGKKGFHPGSKIIITTRNASLTKSCALMKTKVKPEHKLHALHGLDDNGSRELFYSHAFMSKEPKANYEEMSEHFVKYCRGHPSTLKVLGMSLYNKCLDYWDDVKKGLGKEPIYNDLRKSFDSLPFENDRELFKHIACFFVGADRDCSQTILKACEIRVTSGITNLIDRCLLSIGWKNELVMHNLLQEMGRFIVYEESVKKPWKRSRLWDNLDSYEVLKHNKGTRKIVGLSLDMKEFENKNIDETFDLKTNALSQMDKLRLLKLNYLKTYKPYENFPKELRWLCMHGFPCGSVPSDLQMENLVALDLSYSNINSVDLCNQPHKRQRVTTSCSKDKRLFGSLKILNLSFCSNLHCLDGFDEFPALERLIVTNCKDLYKVCESIKACIELVLIDLSYCNNLKQLPKTIGMLMKVETLFLDGCKLGESGIDFMDIDSPELSNANNIDSYTKASSSAIPKAISIDSKFLTSFPTSLIRLSLKNNELKTISFPVDFAHLSKLEELYLDDDRIVSPSNCVITLPCLKNLNGKSYEGRFSNGDEVTHKENQVPCRGLSQMKSDIPSNSHKGFQGFNQTTTYFQSTHCNK